MKRQIAQSVKQKLLERKTQAMAKPKTTEYHPTTSYHSVQTMSTGDGKEIVNRLMDYKFKYSENERGLQDKYDDQECTFKPKINTNSRKFANQMSHGMPLEFRNSIDVNKYNNRSKKEANDRN